MPALRSIEIIPVKCKTRFKEFDLASAILEEFERSNVGIKDGDIIVVSSKFASVSEGRMVELKRIRAGPKARSIAKSYRMQPEIAQLVLNESESILGGIPGFLLAINDGVLAPNSGLDLSNAPKGWAILYPKKRDRTAKRLRTNLLRMIARQGRRISRLGVILSDSRVTPTRLGTVGVAIAVAGIKPTVDMRGKKDLFGNKLKVTLKGLADQIATAAEICMGEASESTPVVLVRGISHAFEKPRTNSERNMTIAPDKCLIISGLRNTRRI